MLVLIIVVVLLAGFVTAGFVGAPWVPTRNHDLSTMLKLCDLKADELFVELGCGDGRVVRAAARRGARVVGYEVNPLLWLIAALKNIHYYPRVRVRFGNFWQYNLHEADVVMVFLIPRLMGRLETKIRTEMKPKSRLISYVFTLPRGRPVAVQKPWVVYRLPLRAWSGSKNR